MDVHRLWAQTRRWRGVTDTPFFVTKNKNSDTMLSPDDPRIADRPNRRWFVQALAALGAVPTVPTEDCAIGSLNERNLLLTSRLCLHWTTCNGRFAFVCVWWDVNETSRWYPESGMAVFHACFSVMPRALKVWMIWALETESGARR